MPKQTVAGTDTPNAGRVKINDNFTEVYDGLAGKEAAGAAASTLSAHVAETDPHTQYQRESEKGQANGYASLDTNAKVPTAQLPTPPVTQQVNVSWTGDGPAEFLAVVACTLSGPTLRGGGTPSVAYAYSADGNTGFNTATFPLSMAAGSVLRITLAGFNTRAAWGALRT